MTRAAYSPALARFKSDGTPPAKFQVWDEVQTKSGAVGVVVKVGRKYVHVRFGGPYGWDKAVLPEWLENA